MEIETLLIHYFDVDNYREWTHHISFSPIDIDIDCYISDTLIPKLASMQYDVIYIHEFLSENYLDLYGLRLAYHIRLSAELGGKRYVPIVILGHIDPRVICRITSSAHILFTQGVYWVKNDKKSIAKIRKRILRSLNIDRFEEKFLDRIEIESPEQSTRHDITNDWAISQWADALGLDGGSVNTVSQKVTSSLYFKYLRAKYNTRKKGPKKIKSFDLSGRVLLVDDKWEEGWKLVMEAFILKKYTDVSMDTLEYDFRDKSFADIEEALGKKILSYDPDVVLLDLRLLAEDNIFDIKAKQLIKKLSGIKIMEIIRDINPGIQIIIFTASGDSLILDELYHLKILGYVKKDAPGDRYLSPRNSFTKLEKLIKEGIKRSYLKEIYALQQKLLKANFLKDSIVRNVEQKEIICEIRRQIEFIFEILESDLPKRYIFAMLTIYKCIELINDYFTIGDKWKSSGKSIDILGWRGGKKAEKGSSYHKSTENRIRNIIYHKDPSLHDALSDTIREIVCSRNYAIHTGINKFCKKYTIVQVKEEKIINWLGMLNGIIDLL